MKSFSATIAIAVFCLLTTASLHAQNPKTKAKTATSMEMPYTAQYSSKFEMGDPKLSAIVLNAWKVYDDNTFDQMKDDIISDTIHAFFADGSVQIGKDSFMTSVKTYRASLSSVKSQVLAYTSLKSIDKKGSFVLIWGSETDGKADGTTQTVDLHEIWGFGKDGKVDFFKQFMATPPPQQGMTH